MANKANISVNHPKSVVKSYKKTGQYVLGKVGFNNFKALAEAMSFRRAVN